MSFEPQRSRLSTIAAISAISSVLLAASFSNAIAMPGQTQSADSPAAVKAGLTAAGRYCMRCHAVIPETRSPNKSAPTFESIAAKYRQHHMAGLNIYDGTVYRHPGMPQFDLQTYEADGLIAYLRWLGLPGR